jgi:hypothetical protein
MCAAAEVERRDDVAPLHMLRDRGKEHRAVVSVVTLEKGARNIDGDDDVRVRVTVGSVAQGDLVQRAWRRRVRTRRCDTQHDQRDPKRDRREPEPPGSPAPAGRVMPLQDRVSPNLALQVAQCCQRAPTIHPPVLPAL